MLEAKCGCREITVFLDATQLISIREVRSARNPSRGDSVLGDA